MAAVVVTARGDETPAAASVDVKPMHLVARALIRSVRAYLFTVAGLLGVSATGAFDPLPLPDFAAVFAFAVTTAVGPGIAALIWNSIELLTKLDESIPQLRG